MYGVMMLQLMFVAIWIPYSKSCTDAEKVSENILLQNFPEKFFVESPPGNASAVSQRTKRNAIALPGCNPEYQFVTLTNMNLEYCGAQNGQPSLTVVQMVCKNMFQKISMLRQCSSMACCNPNRTCCPVYSTTSVLVKYKNLGDPKDRFSFLKILIPRGCICTDAQCEKPWTKNLPVLTPTKLLHHEKCFTNCANLPNSQLADCIQQL